jgi:hypothetical protein
MITLFGPILTVALMAQFQGGTIQGTVVDDQGKPVVNAQVVFCAPAPLEGNLEPLVVQSKTDSEGRYRIATPLAGSGIFSGAYVWVCKPGFALTSAPCDHLPPAIVLHKAAPKTLKVVGPGDLPVAGARISVRTLFVSARTIADVPELLAEPRAVSTGTDGTASLADLGAEDQVVAVRLTADAIGTQSIPLIEHPGTESQESPITIRLNATTRLVGRVRTRGGEPVAGQVVEVWFKGRTFLAPDPVRFTNGPLRTAADGSFQTPSNLLVGSPYRVVVRAPGMEPILSDWMRIGHNTRILRTVLQRPLHTISGRVVDRQGKPVESVEVFQSGDGPERTTTQTDTNGRFALAGFRHGSVFLFARADGFRFFGRMIKPGEGEITIELTRTNERPVREMRMLPDVISLEESRALSRELVEPYWMAMENKGALNRIGILHSLASINPLGVLQKLDELEIHHPMVKSTAERLAVRSLIRDDPDQAAAFADAIEVPEYSINRLVDVADAQPNAKRDDKLALLDRAARHFKASMLPGARLYAMARVADRYCDLGEKEKAKTLFAEGLRIANQLPDKTDRVRCAFAARLARVDLPAALAIAKGFPAAGAYSTNWVLCNIAFHLAADNPAEAERVMYQVPRELGRDWLPPATAWRMATVDPARAQRMVKESQRYCDDPQTYLLLALGLSSRDRTAAHEAFQAAMRGFDRLMKDGSERLSNPPERSFLLPLVEQIDPALVPELFWRAVASRPSVGNPRTVGEFRSSHLAMLLAWYDRDVAAVLFEPVRARIENTAEPALAGPAVDYLCWSIFDPRTAVARLEEVPVNPQFDVNVDQSRQRVAETLELSHSARWRKIWGDFSNYEEMPESIELDPR